MRAEENARPTPDLHQLSDETLVGFAQAHGPRAVAEVLLLRHEDWIAGLIGRLARVCHLPVSDLEDAKQDAVFGLLKAIARYDPRGAGDPSRCSFRSFLYRIITDRFRDFLKHHRRVEAGYDRSVYVDPGKCADDWGEVQGFSPLTTAERNELRASLQTILLGLSMTSRAVTEGVMEGKCLREVANDLGVTYDRVKHRWRRLKHRLSERLGKFTDRTAGPRGDPRLRRPPDDGWPGTSSG